MNPNTDIVTDQKIREIQREYLEFLEDEERGCNYKQMVKDMMANENRRLIVDMNDLRKKYPARASGLLNNAADEYPAFSRALKERIAAELASKQILKEYGETFLGFMGSFGNKHLTPRTLQAKHLGSLVCVEGIVTKCSLIRPKVVTSVHYCPATKKTLERKYTDMTSTDAYPSSSVYPTKDEDGNLLETEYGLCTYKDHQTMTIQEMPEKAPAGQLPRSVDVVLDNDLVDVTKAGDRIQVVGLYRCLPSKHGSFTSGTFRTIVIANNIIKMGKDSTPQIYVQDLMKCKKFAKKHKAEVFDLLAKSLAPSIHGHEYIKRALLCMLLGGVEKILPNGTRLRGDINILLIGDPSVAKSQLLRYVLNTAPRAITTTGRGSSGVGLTAAVTTDQETGDRRLEAGAMVLADRGVVCIDEFDKMSDMDRTAIHEVMEQGRVTISKAGIHARLNARCSVLAAANPVYGRYDQYKTPMENIGLQDSLLSRFDCLFIMLDTADPESDRKISDHVVRMHRYREPLEKEGSVLPMGMGLEVLSTKTTEEKETESKEEPIYETYNALLHANLRSKNDKIVTMSFMKKYIYIARTLKPSLTKEACAIIAESYTNLRSQDTEHTDMARTQPVTARALETLIRLATAHCKGRLGKQVTVVDAEAAIEMVEYAYFKKVLSKKKKVVVEDSETEDEMETDSQVSKKRRRSSSGTDENAAKKPRKKPGDEGYDPYDVESADEMMETEITPGTPLRSKKSPKPKAAPTEISEARLKLFKTLLNKMRDEERASNLDVKRVKSYVNKHESDAFTDEEFESAMIKMTDANQLMVTDGMIFFI